MSELAEKYGIPRRELIEPMIVYYPRVGRPYRGASGKLVASRGSLVIFTMPIYMVTKPSLMFCFRTVTGFFYFNIRHLSDEQLFIYYKTVLLCINARRLEKCGRNAPNK